jgi:hypothetical protein
MKGFNANIDKFEPVSFNKTVVDGRTKYEIVAKINDKENIKTKVEENEGGDVMVEDAETKPDTYTGMEKNPIYMKVDKKMEDKIKSWKDRMMAWFAQRNINVAFNIFEPISFTKTIIGKVVKYDFVVNIDGNKKISTKISEKADGNIEIEEGQEEPDDYTGMESNPVIYKEVDPVEDVD